jgi:hypothetical protein
MEFEAKCVNRDKGLQFKMIFFEVYKKNITIIIGGTSINTAYTYISEKNDRLTKKVR